MTLSLVRSDSSHDRGSCRTRTTDDIAALRSYLNAPAWLRGALGELPAANHSSQDRLHSNLASLQVGHLVVEVLLLVLVDV